MCAPLISRDGQQQSRGVNSCIRVLIIAVMRLCSRASHSPFSPFLEVAERSGASRQTKKKQRWSYLSGFLASVAPFKWRYHHRRWRRGPNWQRKQERCLRRPMRKNNNGRGNLQDQRQFDARVSRPFNVNEKSALLERLRYLQEHKVPVFSLLFFWFFFMIL